jgi:hypothetical protein
LAGGGLFLHRGDCPTASAASSTGGLLEGRGLLLDRGERSTAASASGRVLCVTPAAASASAGWIGRGRASATTA